MDLNSFKDVVKFAIGREEKAIKIYGDMSKITRTPGLRKLFLELQGEERKHKKLLEDIDQTKVQNFEIKAVPDLKISDYLTEEPPSEEMTFQDLLILAAKREQEAVLLYSGMAESVDDPELKKLFGFLIQQEKSHKLKLEKEYDEHVLEQD